MRWAVTLAVLILAAIDPARAADVGVVKFSPADVRATRLLNKLIPDHMQGQDDVPVPQPPTVAWVRISESEPKYLFVLLPWECGVNCPIYGFRKTPKGWAKVYDVDAGDDIEVLKSKTGGRHDIGGTQVDNASSGVNLTSHWDGDRYGKPDRKPYGETEP